MPTIKRLVPINSLVRQMDKPSRVGARLFAPLAACVDQTLPEPGTRTQASKLKVAFPPPLSALLAGAAVRRLLEADPQLIAASRGEISAFVVEVPGTDWVHPVAEAWRELALGTDDVGSDGDGNAALPEQGRWFEFRRDGTDPGCGPERGNLAVASALRSGLPCFGFAPVPAERYLPLDLLRVASHRVRIPPVDSAMLTEVAAEYFGQCPSVSITDALARLVTLDDLELALRPSPDPDAYMRRLGALAETRRPVAAVALDTLCGMDEAVAWGMDLAEDLRAYAAGGIGWADVDGGCLVAGPPGTGKTTWAASVAAWCGVPMVVGGLAKWQASRDGHLGHCLAAMRDDFDRARQAAPCILFVDEADSFGSRGGADPGSRDYHTQVINALLEQLDGLGGRAGVVVVTACNHPGRMDPALVRSGRLDRVIRIELPDSEALVGMLQHHLGADLPMAGLRDVAMAGLGCTGTDVARWVRGARRAARRQRRAVLVSDLLAEMPGACDKPDPATLRRIAVHEAGHAVMAAVDRPGSLRRVTIRQTGRFTGAVFLDKLGATVTHKDLRATLRLLLAGRAAELTILGGASGGAGGSEHSDLARATAIAVEALGSLGLGDQLLWIPQVPAQAIGSALASRPDLARSVSALLDEVHAETMVFAAASRVAIENLADRLLTAGSLDGADVHAMLLTAAVSAP